MKKLYFLITIICNCIFANAQLTLISFSPSTVSPGDYVAVVQASGPYFNGIHEYDSLTNYIDVFANSAVVLTAFAGTEYNYDPVSYTFTIDFLPSNAQFLSFTDADDISYQTISLITPLHLSNCNINVNAINGGNLITWQINQTFNIAKTELQYATNGNDFKTISIKLSSTKDSYLDDQFTNNVQYYKLKITCHNGDVFYSNIIKTTSKIPNAVPYNFTNIIAQGNNVIFSNNCNAHYYISNTNGAKILQGLLSTTNNFINTNCLSVGNYFITFMDNNVRNTYQLIIR